MEPCTSYEYLFAKVIGQVISNAFLIFSINCNSSSINENIEEIKQHLLDDNMVVKKDTDRLTVKNYPN